MCMFSQDANSVEIVCDGADNFVSAVAALGDLSNVRVKTLIIQNTPIGYLPDLAFQNLQVKVL